MPIPQIVWGVATGATAIYGSIKGLKARHKIKKARRKLEISQNLYDKYIINFKKKHEHVSLKINELGELRLKAVELLGEVVVFLHNAKIKERDIEEKYNITIEELASWKEASINASDVLKGILGAVASGVGTASGTYSLIGLLASASTGTAIKTLGGVAAKNATLAWLGGGTLASGGGGVAAGTTILGGLVVGPAILISGCVYDKSANKFKTQVEENISKLKQDEAEKRKVIVVLDKVLDRVEELTINTDRLMLRLREQLDKTNSSNTSEGFITRIIQRVRRILGKTDPSKIKEAYVITKLAKSLADLLEAKVFDEEGKIH